MISQRQGLTYPVTKLVVIRAGEDAIGRQAIGRKLRRLLCRHVIDLNADDETQANWRLSSTDNNREEISQRRKPMVCQHYF